MKKPNILVICSDQHHAKMSGYAGHPVVKTPNLDRLAAEGTAFENAYCNSPVCTPSRMSFITGKYVHQIGSWFMGIPLDAKEMTWPRRLKNAGIPATMLGKMDFCGAYQSGGFSDYKIIERRQAWDTYPRNTPFEDRLSNFVRKDKLEHILHAGVRQDRVTDGADGHNDALGFYDHDRHVTDWAVNYLREKNGKSEPWALYVGLLYPHWPYCVPKEYFDRYYPDVDLPKDARFPNPDLHPEVRHFQDCMGFRDMTEERLRRVIAAYYGMITCLDDNIGRILNELNAQGLADDTYVIYTTDHGEALGTHGLFYKQTAYEGSVGVPLLMKGPGIPAGKRAQTPVSLVDMYPTVLDMAGLEAEADRPGHSWLPIAKGMQPGAPDVFSEYHGNFFRQDWYMLRNARYKYVHYENCRPSLFDLETDPDELFDLALKEDDETRQLLQKFRAALAEIVDTKAISTWAKRDLGLIGPDGEDYTKTLTAGMLQEGRRQGRFPPEPGYVPDFSSFTGEY